MKSDVVISCIVAIDCLVYFNFMLQFHFRLNSSILKIVQFNLVFLPACHITDLLLLLLFIIIINYYCKNCNNNLLFIQTLTNNEFRIQVEIHVCQSNHLQNYSSDLNNKLSPSVSHDSTSPFISTGGAWIRTRRIESHRPAIHVPARVCSQVSSEWPPVPTGFRLVQGRSRHLTAAGKSEEPVAKRRRPQRSPAAGICTWNVYLWIWLYSLAFQNVLILVIPLFLHLCTDWKPVQTHHLPVFLSYHNHHTFSFFPISTQFLQITSHQSNLSKPTLVSKRFETLYSSSSSRVHTGDIDPQWHKTDCCI